MQQHSPANQSWHDALPNALHAVFIVQLLVNHLVALGLASTLGPKCLCSSAAYVAICTHAPADSIANQVVHTTVLQEHEGCQAAGGQQEDTGQGC